MESNKYNSVQSKVEFQPPISYEEADARAGLLLKSMTLDEKIELAGGHNLFFTAGFDTYKIPEFYFADSTQGVHIREQVRQHLEKSTAFPCPLALAATWNAGLSGDYARAIGQQCRAGDVAVLLGPGVNIYRISQCGRNFEYFGEDPFLAARMVERYVVGMQSTGTIATLKHFCCNNTDHRRRRSNSIVDERTLHEIYLPAFEAGINAGAMAVMTSYNQVNGEWTGQSKAMITDVLRGQLGFQWLVMSDWWSIYDPQKAVKSGLDMDMPGEPSALFPDAARIGDVYVKTNAKRLLQANQITESDIERMARSVLRTFIAAGLFDRPVKDEAMTANYAHHEQIALQTARESIVLLRNEGNILPVVPGSRKRILLTGWFTDTIAGGKGAAEVKGYNPVTLQDALSRKYGDCLNFKKEPADQDLAQADLVIVSIGTIDSEGYDRPFDLPREMNDLIAKASSLNPNTVVIVYSGGGVNMSAWNEKVRAILYAWYPGQNGNVALAEILAGDTCPSAKLPITIEKCFADSPGYGYKPAQEPLDMDFSADLRFDIPVKDVRYDEGVFVGYRWYEKMNITPLYPFGHGLSYASFRYDNLRISRDGFGDHGWIRVQCDITNTANRPAMEIVELYIHPEKPSLPRPVKELKGFAKITLKAGSSGTAVFDLTERDFAYWDVRTGGWKTEQGRYRISVGSSSAAIHLAETMDIQ